MLFYHPVVTAFGSITSKWNAWLKKYTENTFLLILTSLSINTCIKLNHLKTGKASIIPGSKLQRFHGTDYLIILIVMRVAFITGQV